MVNESEKNHSGEKQKGPIFEILANYIEEEAKKWQDEPEKQHPLSGAIKNGWYKTEVDRREAVHDDANEVAEMLMNLAAEVRTGHFTKMALNFLRLRAHHSKEALQLLKTFAPEAKPYQPDGDINGNPVEIGKVYRWQPSSDNRGNEPGYYYEGTVGNVYDGWAEGSWVRKGEPNPKYQFREEKEESTEDIHNASRVFTTMLTPVEKNNDENL